MNLYAIERSVILPYTNIITLDEISVSNIWQCLHGLLAEQLSLNPPIALLAGLSAITQANVPYITSG